MRWKRLYQGQGPTDAHIVRDWLQSRGLTLQLRGEGLSGLGGAIPISDAYPSVWVLEADLDKARAALDEYDKATTGGQGWICEQCAEWNPGNFGSCWSCEADRPELDP